MRDDAQPRYYAPRTHTLTLGELRRMLKSVEDVPDAYVVRGKNSTAFEVFEAVQEIHGVEVFETTGALNLPID